MWQFLWGSLTQRKSSTIVDKRYVLTMDSLTQETTALIIYMVHDSVVEAAAKATPADLATKAGDTKVVDESITTTMADMAINVKLLA